MLVKEKTYSYSFITNASEKNKLILILSIFFVRLMKKNYNPVRATMTNDKEK